MDLSYRWAVARIGVPHPASWERGLIIWLVALAAGVVLAAVSGASRRAVSLLALAVLAVDLIGQGAWLEVDSHDPTTGLTTPGSGVFAVAARPRASMWPRDSGRPRLRRALGSRASTG